MVYFHPYYVYCGVQGRGYRFASARPSDGLHFPPVSQTPVLKLAWCGSILLIAATAHAQIFNGHLESSDTARPDGAWYDAYSFEAADAQHVLIRMEAPDFDSFLIVRSPSGIETVNDDFESSNVSQLDFFAADGGTWTVWASAYSGGLGGAYSLEITLGGIGTIETLTGRLDPTDAVALKGEYFDTHLVHVESPASFAVELISYGFDGYLVVTSPAGEVWRNDDAQSQTLSRVGPVQGPGTWRVDVTSAGPDQVGAYDVKIITFPAN